MAFLKFLLKRIVAIFVTISAIIAIGYIMMYYSPGGFFNSSQLEVALGPLAAQDPALYQKVLAEFQNRYGLNLPLWHQILLYIWHSVTFNFGNSMQNPSVKIMDVLKSTFPVSAELSAGSVFVAVVIGIPLGVIAALKRNTWIDSVVSTVAMVGQAIPSFVLAVIFVLLFGVVWPNILPVTGWGTPADAVLPVLTLAAGNIGVVARYMRGSLIEVLRQDFVRTAKAKGIRYWPIVFRHGIRNSLTALITVVGPTFAFTVVSTVWIENIYSIPGMGTQLNTAFTNSDYPLAITSMFILGMMVMLVNLCVDMIYSWIDPRVKLE